MKKKLKKKKDKFNKNIFKLITIEPHERGLIVFISDDWTKINKFLNLKKNKTASDWLKPKLPKGFSIPEKALGAVITTEEEQPVILFLKNPIKREWDWYETLLHECVHIVNGIENIHSHEDEWEFRAYLTEYLFRTIRRMY